MTVTAPNIETLIDKQDTFEIIRDEIGAILAVEIAQQQVLAKAAGKDKRLWELAVFSEATNAWAQYLDPPEDQPAATPIVNVWWDSKNYDDKASNTVERQKAEAVYNIDCYGYGLSTDDPEGGHTPGDSKAALEAQRAVRLVRNILMSGQYTYLGQRGLVWRRLVQSINTFQPTLEERPAQNVSAARIAFGVHFNEFSPQVQPVTMELISVIVERASDGKLLVQADYPATPP